jgi:hypothetical protein
VLRGGAAVSSRQLQAAPIRVQHQPPPVRHVLVRRRRSDPGDKSSASAAAAAAAAAASAPHAKTPPQQLEPDANEPSDAMQFIQQAQSFMMVRALRPRVRTELSPRSMAATNNQSPQQQQQQQHQQQQQSRRNWQQEQQQQWRTSSQQQNQYKSPLNRQNQQYKIYRWKDWNEEQKEQQDYFDPIRQQYEKYNYVSTHNLHSPHSYTSIFDEQQRIRQLLFAQRLSIHGMPIDLTNKRNSPRRDDYHAQEESKQHEQQLHDSSKSQQQRYFAEAIPHYKRFSPSQTLRTLRSPTRYHVAPLQHSASMHANMFSSSQPSFNWQTHAQKQQQRKFDASFDLGSNANVDDSF